MKWMAAGEIGAFILGLTSAHAVVLFLNLNRLAELLVFMGAWYLATKWSLWFVHLGFDGKVSGRA